MAASSTTISINARPVEITADQVFLATRDNTPDPIRTYSVFVNGNLWPPIQLIRLVTGIPGNTGDVTNYVSHDALKALDDLGFRTLEPVEYDAGGNVIVRETRKRTQTAKR